MRATYQYFASLTGWKAWFVMLLSGAMMTLTFAPFHVFPLVVPALAVLFIQLRSVQNARMGFWRGWAWGFGFFVSGTYWISIALLVDAEQFAWLIPFALFGLTGVLAVYIAIVGYVFVKLRRSSFWHAAFLFVLLFSLAEVARGNLFTGFPWNLVGYSTMAVPELAQWTSVFGTYGLGLMIVLWSIMWLGFEKKRNYIFWLAIPMLAMAYQQAHLKPDTHMAGATVRVVQGNIEQALKWDPNYKREIVERYQRLSSKPGLERIDLVIWPEATLPYAVAPDTQWLPQLASFMHEGQLLITGATRSNEEEFWNSILVIDHTGKVVSYYDKHHLVPFGEYVPFSEYLPMQKIAPGFGEFSRGERGSVLQLDSLPIMSPLVCYEAIFSSYADTAPRAELMLNLTNDAWFGKSIGPYQHEAMARMRAIEQGVALLRVANTGISGFYDSKGQALHRTQLGQTTMFDVELALSSDAETIYSQYGEHTYLILLLICGLVVLFIREKTHDNV